MLNYLIEYYKDIGNRLNVYIHRLKLKSFTIRRVWNDKCFGNVQDTYLYKKNIENYDLINHKKLFSKKDDNSSDDNELSDDDSNKY